MNPRKTTVESKGSKEFHVDKDVLTVEVVHAARILEEFFAKQGYDEWILMGVCSRKLLEKVQQRMPVMHRRPATAQERIEVGPPPTNCRPAVGNREFVPHTGQPGEFGGVEEMSAMGPEEHRRFEEHLARRRQMQEEQVHGHMPSISTSGIEHTADMVRYPVSREEQNTQAYGNAAQELDTPF